MRTSRVPTQGKQVTAAFPLRCSSICFLSSVHNQRQQANTHDFSTRSARISMNRHTGDLKAREAAPEEDPMCPVPSRGEAVEESVVSTFMSPHTDTNLGHWILEVSATALCAKSQFPQYEGVGEDGADGAGLENGGLGDEPRHDAIRWRSRRKATSACTIFAR